MLRGGPIAVSLNVGVQRACSYIGEGERVGVTVLYPEEAL